MCIFGGQLLFVIEKWDVELFGVLRVWQECALFEFAEVVWYGVW